MSSEFKLIVKMAYEVYYITEFSKGINESVKNNINNYLEKNIQQGIEQISDISEDFISPSRYYNVLTTINIVKQIPSDHDKKYEESDIYVKGVNAYIKYEDIMNKIQNKTDTNYIRFIIDDIISKNGFLAEDVGKYLFSNSENIIKQYLYSKLNLMDNVKPTDSEKICFMIIYPIEPNKFIKIFNYSKNEEIKNNFDMHYGQNKFDKIISYKNKNELLNYLIQLTNKNEEQINKFIEKYGCKI